MYIKQVEITNFKSFGGTVSVQLLPGFTVISGPNGSGKSNILDALLFALGLSSSKGMRAERLPDLVNHGQTSKKGRGTVEATVAVTFDLSEEAAAIATEDIAHLQNGHAESNGTASDGATSNGAHHGDQPVDISVDINVNESIDEADLGEEIPETAAVDTAGTLPVAFGEAFRDEDGNPMTEWKVMRKLRVTQQGTYTSNYYINDHPATLSELHQQLAALRIYPEGYNIVLQGDVTSIITMNARERRQIIDEMAGVANFDRKIEQTRRTLEEVKEREERCRILEGELQERCERLAGDRQKALKYQKLKEEFGEKSGWEQVLRWQVDRAAIAQGEAQIERDRTEIEKLGGDITQAEETARETGIKLNEINQKVKALGESEQRQLQTQLANQQAQLSLLQRRSQELLNDGAAADVDIKRLGAEFNQLGVQISGLTQQEPAATSAVNQAKESCDRLTSAVELQRDAAAKLAEESQAWVTEQTDLRHQIDELQGQLTPLQSEQTRLQERLEQLSGQQGLRDQELAEIGAELGDRRSTRKQLATTVEPLQEKIQKLVEAVAGAEQAVQIQTQTRDRLLNEQRQKQRQLDKLEAQAQAIQEAQGTHATQVLIQSGLRGLHGLVAQLGQVEPRYQTALEIAAGARLAYLVVDDDRVAAEAIAWLKQQRAGRSTFLPLTKFSAGSGRNSGPTARPQGTRFATQRGGRDDGWVDYAVNLVTFEPDYQGIFEYVFGSTVVFESVDQARRNLGKYRMVTLDGELLETSGAMTGGSISRRRGGVHFGTKGASAKESREMTELSDRLAEIDRILERCDIALTQANLDLKEHTKNLNEARQGYQGDHQRLEAVTREVAALERRLEARQLERDRLSAEQQTSEARLEILAPQMPEIETALTALQEKLRSLEDTGSHNEWQQTQALVRSQETQLQVAQQNLAAANQALQELHNQRDRLGDRQSQTQERQKQLQQAQRDRQEEREQLTQQTAAANRTIQELQNQIKALDKVLGETQKQRDALEETYRNQKLRVQELVLERRQRREQMTDREAGLAEKRTQIAEQFANLPDPLPEIPNFDPENPGEPTRVVALLENLQKSLRSLQRRIEALEPVNMLALQEFDRVRDRLNQLSGKLETLEQERTELLLRAENFATLRFQAFKETFDAVDKNFRVIFAELSQGDGRLQLDNAQDPLAGGLNLVAHPKGKPVQRLTSMSGGEKSLTSLSFIFALQRYRPSPFYAFDEVDMFLDGANVERLAKMVTRQAQQAQFIVVSLRRPTIEASDRTIGVTQARGAHTQVLGIAL
ncbi:MAG: chromosome segregation protein SMC [Cyanobacteria bacterium P01_C01_bin.89]